MVGINQLGTSGTLKKTEKSALPALTQKSQNFDANSNVKVSQVALKDKLGELNGIKNTAPVINPTQTLDQKKDSKIDLSFGSTKPTEKPPQQILDIIAKAGISFDYMKDYISHFSGMKTFTVFAANGSEFVVDTQSGNIVTSRIGEPKNTYSQYQEDSEKLSSVIEDSLNSWSPDNLKKMYGEDDLEDISESETQSIDVNQENTPDNKEEIEKINNQLSLIKNEAYSVISKKDPVSIARHAELRKQIKELENKKRTLEIGNKDIQQIDEGENPWAFAEKYVQGKTGPVSSEDALRQEYQELNNKVSAEGYTEEEREEALEKRIAIEKMLTNLDTVTTTTPDANIDTSKDNSLETSEVKIGKAKSFAELAKILKDIPSIRVGRNTHWSGGEINQKIRDFINGINPDSRNIPEELGIREKVLELKKIQDENNAFSNGSNPDDAPITLEEQDGQELEDGADVSVDVPGDSVVDTSSEPAIPDVLQQVPQTPVLTPDQVQQQKNLEQLELLKKALVDARDKYGNEQGEYIKQSYIDRFNAKLTNLFGNSSEVTQKKFNAHDEYKKARTAYYEALGRSGKNPMEIMSAMSEENKELADTLPPTTRQKLGRFAGKLGMGLGWLTKGVGTLANTYRGGTEYVLTKGFNMSEENAQKYAKVLGAVMLGTTFGVGFAVAGGAALTTAGIGGIAAKTLGAMAGAEAVDRLALKKIFKNNTEGEVLESVAKQLGDQDLSSPEARKKMERTAKNAKLWANLNLAARTALKLTTGAAAGMAVDSFLNPSVTEAAATPTQPVVESAPAPVETVPVTPTLTDANAFVGTGEGVTHPILRQLQADPELAKAFGITGAPTPLDALKVAQDFGYVDQFGNEIRVIDGNNAAYDLVMENGKPVVNEWANGAFQNKISSGALFENGNHQDYEYLQNIANKSVNNLTAGIENSHQSFETETTWVPEQQSTIQLDSVEPRLYAQSTIDPKTFNPFINSSAPFDASNVQQNIEHLRQIYPTATSEQLSQLAKGVEQAYTVNGITTPPTQILSSSSVQTVSQTVNPDMAQNLSQPSSTGTPKMTAEDIFRQT